MVLETPSGSSVKTGRVERAWQRALSLTRWGRGGPRSAKTGAKDDFDLWRRKSVRRILSGVFAEFAVVVVGVCGYVLLGWPVFDAFYMVIITISGVGFGEVRVMVNPLERINTILVIVFGMLAVGYTLARFIQLLTEGEIQNLLGHVRMRRQLEMLNDHVIIAGFGRIGSLVSEELARAGLAFVVIDISPKKTDELEAKGYLYVVGDANEESVLRDAGMERAKVLVSVMPSDAANVFITLTARQLAPKARIVARAELPSTQKKLKQAGADHVILPAVIGAHRIVSLLTRPSAMELVELVTRQSSLEIEMDEIPIQTGNLLHGQTLRHADIGRKTGIMVIAVKRADGRVEFPPSGDEPLANDDSLVVLGRQSNLEQFRKLFAT